MALFEEYFEGKKRLYPQAAKGRFRRLKWFLNAVFLSVYCFSSFIRFDRGADAPNQAILIDIPGSKLYFFAIEIYPQEIYYLMGILIFAALLLFFITSLFGRIWCGYACFQTVWTDIFIYFEKIFQGDRNQRIILDRKNNFEKFYKKSLTHLSWIITSLLTGFFFTCYFNDSFLLVRDVLAGEINLSILWWILGIGFATYVMAGFAREHVCTYMCPYARFQSAMFDKNTLIITYDEKRGEKRGKLQKNSAIKINEESPHLVENLEVEKQGDCIDCKQCVVVCPTGIDIRDGLQMECIACGLCVDACDEIMEKIGKPKGLIRYDTLNHLSTGDEKTKFKIFKPRTFLYLTILIIVSTLMLRSLILKSDLQVGITADRNPLFVTLSNGDIRNGYNLRILNKTHQDKIFNLRIANPNQASLKINRQLKVPADKVRIFKIYVTVPKSLIEKSLEKRILIDLLLNEESLNQSDLDKEEKIQTIFIGG